MELDKDGVSAWLERFGDEDPDVDGLVVNLFVGCAVDVEAVEARFWRRVVERGHGFRCYV
jgi:hypothetical protein